MAMHDEVREQQQKLKGKSFKEKMNYFWYYYKAHTIIAVIAIIILSIFIKDMLSAKDSAFYAMLLNAYGYNGQEALQADFAAYAGIDTETYDCFIDTSSTLSYETMSQAGLATSQRIVAMVQTGDMDVLVADSEAFTTYAKGGMFLDLRNELTKEEFEKLEPYFYYIDRSVIEADPEEIVYDENGIPIDTQKGVDHTDPSAMEDPIPVGIYLDSFPKLAEYGCYLAAEEPTVFGFVFSSVRKETCHLFLQYLTE